MIAAESKLNELIEERIMVLFEIEKTLFTKRYNLKKIHYEIFSVQSISMVYSLWEGFVQRALQIYISEINSQNLDFESLSDDLLVFFMENEYKQFFEYPQNHNKKVMFFKSLKTQFNCDQYQLPLVVDTNSNLGFEETNKLLAKLSLGRLSEFWGEKYTSPNKSLKDVMKQFLKYRNGVAHGGDISSEEKVTQEVYVKYKSLVTDLMYEINDRIICSLKDELYLKK